MGMIVLVLFVLQILNQYFEISVADMALYCQHVLFWSHSHDGRWQTYLYLVRNMRWLLNSSYCVLQFIYLIIMTEARMVAEISEYTVKITMVGVI